MENINFLAFVSSLSDSDLDRLEGIIGTEKEARRKMEIVKTIKKSNGFTIIYPIDADIPGFTYSLVGIPVCLFSNSCSQYDIDIDDDAVVEEFNNNIVPEWMEGYLPDFDKSAEYKRTSDWECMDYEDPQTAFGVQKAQVWYKPISIRDNFGLCVDSNSNQELVYVKYKSKYRLYTKMDKDSETKDVIDLEYFFDKKYDGSLSEDELEKLYLAHNDYSLKYFSTFFGFYKDVDFDYIATLVPLDSDVSSDPSDPSDSSESLDSPDPSDSSDPSDTSDPLDSLEPSDPSTYDNYTIKLAAEKANIEVVKLLLGSDKIDLNAKEQALKELYHTLKQSRPNYVSYDIHYDYLEMLSTMPLWKLIQMGNDNLGIRNTIMTKYFWWLRLKILHNMDNENGDPFKVALQIEN